MNETTDTTQTAAGAGLATGLLSGLTDEQAAVVEHARQALEAAKAETDWTPGALAAHLGTVRWELSEVLFVVGQLTGGRA